jgi:hypothetical protein
MMEYLEKLRAKPGAVRERIALGAAACFTAIVAIAWGAVIATNGTFVLAPSTFSVASTDTTDINSAIAQTKSGFSDLLGAAAAFQSDSKQASGITVDTQASTTANQGTATVIPF